MIISNLQYCDCFCITSLVIYHSLFLPFSIILPPSAYSLRPHTPHFLISKFANYLISIPLFRRSLLVTTPPLLGRSLRIGEYVIGVRIPFLSPRNPVFTIFNPVVLYYYSITYTPFLYQSSKIRISFL